MLTMSTVLSDSPSACSTVRCVLQRYDAKAPAWCALGFVLILAAPPVRAWFEHTMTRHMLLQLPLLGFIGVCLAAAWAGARHASPAGRALRSLQRFNAGGATGILAASFVMMLWMLPRCLDGARLDPSIDALKFLTVPLAGLMVAVSWPRLPLIARAVVHIEVIASLFRFGWGYLAADTRLCLAYLADDQQRAGELLLWIGAAYAVIVVWRPMFGTAAQSTQVRASR